MKCIITIISLIIFINSYSQTQYKNDSLNMPNTVIVKGYWVQYYSTKPHKGYIDNPSNTFFIESDNYNPNNIKKILNNYKSIIKKNYALYLTWQVDADVFFQYYPSIHSTEKWELESPLTECKIYKVGDKYIKTSFCCYKAYKQKVKKDVLKIQLLTNQIYFDKIDTPDIYLFYKLI